MGDRHNIGIVQYRHRAERPSSILWLYSHSGFYTGLVEGFAASLAHALDNARERWDADAYFNRLIIHTLGESVRGISVNEAVLDEHRRYVVDNHKQKVFLIDPARNGYTDFWYGAPVDAPPPLVTFGFEAFLSKYSRHGALSHRTF